MAHCEVCLETKGDCEADFVVDASQHSRQPSTLARVREQENDVMLFDEFFQFLSIFEHF